MEMAEENNPNLERERDRDGIWDSAIQAFVRRVHNCQEIGTIFAFIAMLPRRALVPNFNLATTTTMDQKQEQGHNFSALHAVL